MKSLIKRFSAMVAVAFTTIVLFSIGALAQDLVLAPADFISEVVSVVKGLGGLSQMGKISAILLLLVASMKVSFLNDILWSKLGKLKAFAAPLLGLVAGILSIGHDQKISLALVLAYVSAGVGAVLLHELLDLVKQIPGLGKIYVSIIDVVENCLGGPSSKA